MKKLKFISVMMCCLAAMTLTFTSCDDDDDDNRGLTPQEQQTAFNAVRGSYSGNMIYSAVNPKNSKDVSDTVAVTWNIATDSTMTINNFPIARLGDNVTDSTVRKAIQAQAPQTLNCYIGFIRLNPITFLINPVSVTLNLNYGGADHKVQIPFYVNSYYSYGAYQTATTGTNVKSSMTMQIIEAAIYIDGKQTSLLRQGTPFVFVAQTK